MPRMSALTSPAIRDAAPFHQRYKIQGGMDLLPRAMASALRNIVHWRARRPSYSRIAGPTGRQGREGCVSASVPGRVPASRHGGQPHHLRDSVHDITGHRIRQRCQVRHV
jgi:hypothetical protein